MSRARTDGLQRAVIEDIRPRVDGGRFPVKRVAGDVLAVEADVFGDGHDALRCALQYRAAGETAWTEAEMHFVDNDRWGGEFTLGPPGRYSYTVTAWVDRFLSWRRDFEKRIDTADIALALETGAILVEQAARRAAGADARALKLWAARLRDGEEPRARRAHALSAELLALVNRYPDRASATRFEPELEVVADPPRARCSAWYELFPRSCAAQGGHGTFRDCQQRLEYVAALGFDVLYLPPVHPIGRTNRKGRNNSLAAQPGDPGSPWAIGGEAGGHKAVHPELGSLEDFRRLVEAARERGIELALDIAFQCAPDHPYAAAHPEWFRRLPDGSIQYAENPPKKYQDIYPLDFESAEWRALHAELKSVFEFWIGQGVTIFRVDNPHTKPFSFWEWVITDLKRAHPEAMFLSEAFTRPKVMHRLAKAGFTQSYTYFPWRNTKAELTEYFTELTQGGGREYFRPNHWPNTPDILTGFLQAGGRPAFISRLILAATLGANYGIYGPAFEQCENRPREPGSEEYLNSEKYEIRHWDLDQPGNIGALVAAVNEARRGNPALQQDWNLVFIPVDNEQLICYAKHTDDRSSVVIVAVNLDPRNVQWGWVQVPLDILGVPRERPYEVEDLLAGVTYTWSGPRNYIRLDPNANPAHVFRVRILAR